MVGVGLGVPDALRIIKNEATVQSENAFCDEWRARRKISIIHVEDELVSFRHFSSFSFSPPPASSA